MALQDGSSQGPRSPQDKKQWHGWRQQLLGVGSAPCHKNEQEASWQDHRFRDCKTRRICKNTRGDTKGSQPPGWLLAPAIAPLGNHASEDNKCRLRARGLPPGTPDTSVSGRKLRNFKRTSLEECESQITHNCPDTLGSAMSRPATLLLTKAVAACHSGWPHPGPLPAAEEPLHPGP